MSDILLCPAGKQTTKICFTLRAAVFLKNGITKQTVKKKTGSPLVMLVAPINKCLLKTDTSRQTSELEEM
ncbi:hypothetical protein ACW6RP_000678 [Shigella sonnei]